jgi:hypothetical protein
MCNCGKKRNEFQNNAPAAAAAPVNPPAAAVAAARPAAKPGAVMPGQTSIAYFGKTALTITGTITGKRYRFRFPGDIQAIDNRDVPALVLVPVLKLA